MNKILESETLRSANQSRQVLGDSLPLGQNLVGQDFVGQNLISQNLAQTTPPPLLEVKNLCFYRFSGKNFHKSYILKNINFTLEKGEVLSILGCNGVGKTTLLKCLLGFIKPSGEIFLNGQNLTLLGRAMWDAIAYSAQNKGATLPISVLEMVVLGLNNVIKFKPSKEHFRQASEVLAELGIAHLENKNCAFLSGGELQMVLFARALVKRPKILILDEPESNLDFANQKMILDTLKGLSKQGCTIIINTHFPAHALFLSHKVLLLSKIGRDCSIEVDSNGIFGTSEELLNERYLSQLYNVPLELHSKITPFKHSEFIVRI